MLTIADVAHHLDLPEKTIRRWVRQGRIPVIRRGDELLFDRRELEEWAREHQIRFITRSREEREGAVEPVSLVSALDRGTVFRCTACVDSRSVLETLAERAPVDPGDRAQLLELLLEREELSSTGIGRGVAVPHPRRPMGTAIEHASLTCAVLDEPVDFSAVDGQPVDAFFLLLSPSTREHLTLLSRLAYCLRDDRFLEVVHGTASREAIAAEIARVEHALAEKRG